MWCRPRAGSAEDVVSFLHSLCTFLRIVRRMTLSVTQKLCLAFVGLTLMMLAATLALARWSFERGFLDYVNALEQVRLEHLRDRLAMSFDERLGGWSATTLAPLFSAGPRRLPPPAGHGRPPPPPGQGGPEAHPGMPGPPDMRQGPPTALLDEDGMLLAGRMIDAPPDARMEVPVRIGDELVATLVSVPRRQLDAAPETAFSAQQFQASLVIGASALLAAVAVSLLLAGALVAPLQRALLGVQALADGDYAHRLDEPRKDEIGLLMRDLDRLGGTLQENRLARNRWIADISHELRTPVAVLSGELEAIRDGVRKADSTQLASLAEEVARLEKLIDDLYELSLADIGGLRYEFVEADLSDVVLALTDNARARLQSAGMELTLDVPPRLPVRFDRRRIEQLLMNLIENSLAYTDSPGVIRLALTDAGEGCRLVIEDSPPGVPAAESEALFEPLHRLESSRSRRTAGAGLGLAICRNIVEAHGGEIRAKPSGLGGLRVEASLWSSL